MRLEGDLAFGETLAGLTNTRPLQVWNDGNSPFNVTGTTWSNNTPTAFTTTPATLSVPAGTSATLNVIFAPRTSATWNATLVLTCTNLTGGARSIAAGGSAKQVRVTLGVDPPDGGRATGAGFYNVGVSTNLTATPSNGWKFVAWSDGPTNRTRTLVVPTNDVSLTANFTITNGVLTISPTNLVYGDVPVTLSVSQAVTLANSGPGSIAVTAVSLPTGYTASVTSFSLASGATRQVYLIFRPTATNNYGGGVRFTTSAARTIGSPVTVAGRGIPQTRIIRLDGNLVFGEVLGGLTNTRPLTVYNDGNSLMNVTAVTFSNNTPAAFSATPTVLAVPAGGSAGMNVNFAPKTSGTWNATVWLTVSNLTGGTRSIPAGGSAKQVRVTLSADPSNGGRTTGSGFYNSGATAAITATPSNGWRFAGWSDGPTNASRALAVRTNDIALSASFLPTGAVNAVLSFSPTNLPFGDVPVGSAATQKFTLANSGPAAVTVSGFQWPAGFATTSTAFTLAAGAAREVPVAFQPAAGAAYGGNVTVLSNAKSNVNRLAVSGSGVDGTRIIRLEGNLDFGEQLTEQAVSLPLRVYNDGTAALTVGSVSWTNNADGSFSVAPATLAVPAGTSGVLTVTFRPKLPQRYDLTVLTLNVAGLTGGTNSIAVAGGASAWGNGTWTASLAVSGAPIPVTIAGTAYVWQAGTTVLAEVVAIIPPMYGGGSIDGIFSGAVQNRTNIPGLFSNNGATATPLTLTYKANAATPSDPTIISGAIPYQSYTILATFHPRTSTNSPSRPKPVMLTVRSAYGGASPSVGTHGFVSGRALTNTVSGVQQIGGSQFVCTGWRMTGNEPVAGAGTSMVMVQTNHATLTWVWGVTNYLLTSTAEAGGTLAGDTNGWYAAGTAVAVTAVPDAGYLFAGWTGDVADDTNSARLALTMDRARTVAAHFVPDVPAPAPLLSGGATAPAAPTPVAARATKLSAAEAAAPALTFLALAPPGGAPLPFGPDGRCAVVVVRGGVVAAVACGEGATAADDALFVLRAEGGDADANGLPDAMDAALGAPLPDGWELLVLRDVGGWLRLETSRPDALLVDGPPVPDAALPACWQVVPRLP
jgi:hypothetical protein